MTQSRLGILKTNPNPLRNRTERGLRRLGFLSLGVYLAWNAFWLLSGRTPPSLFYSVTGLPCPTTGGTRSFLSLLHGKIHESISHNPITVPMVALLLAMLIRLTFLIQAGKKIELSKGWLIAWIVVLGIAWAAQILLFLGEQRTIGARHLLSW